ncbi:MAG: glycosyltransferase family 2 protein [Bacteroidaceae bacterium]|nr:glycosyltransferase family 2 protein [Bacteroidaceae bacterium]
MRIPLVSVIIPLHNAAPYIAECIESVLNQSYTSVETIVVENGSTDASLAIAKRYESDQVHIVVADKANVSSARNLGLSHAKGEYVLFLDADDKLDKLKLEIQMKTMAENEFNPSIVCVSDFYSFDGSESYAGDDLKHVYRPAIDFLIDLFESKSSLLNCSCYLVHRTLAEKCEPWNESLIRCEDWVWMSHILSKADTVIFEPSAISYYRMNNSNSLSKRFDECAIDSEFRGRAEVARILSRCKSPQKDKVIEGLIMGWNRTFYPFFRLKRKKAEKLFKELVPNCQIKYPKISWREKLYYIGVCLHILKSSKKP